VTAETNERCNGDLFSPVDVLCLKIPRELDGLWSIHQVALCRAERSNESIKVVEIDTDVRAAHPYRSILRADLTTCLREGEEATRRVFDCCLRSVLEEEWYFCHLFHWRLASEVVDAIANLYGKSANVGGEQLV
jgi:hypothetical protein